MARAFGSYPKCHRFKSSRRYQGLFSGPAWRVGQAAKTPPFHGGNTGSIPVQVIFWEETDNLKGCLFLFLPHSFFFLLGFSVLKPDSFPSPSHFCPPVCISPVIGLQICIRMLRYLFYAFNYSPLISGKYINPFLSFIKILRSRNISAMKKLSGSAEAFFARKSMVFFAILW